MNISIWVFTAFTCIFIGNEQVIAVPVVREASSTTETSVSTIPITIRKCIEYQQLLYNNKHNTVQFKCPIERERLKADGQKKVVPKELPHMALLGSEIAENGTIDWFCDGSLISENFVLTAAHCVSLRDIDYVLLGQIFGNQSEENVNLQRFNVSEIFIYPGYDNASKLHDIALIEISGPVLFTDYVRPTCLQVANGLYDVPFASSFRDFNDDGVNLTSLALKSIPNELCGLSTDSKETRLCAGSKVANSTFEQGNTGGPLQVYHPSLLCMYDLVGVSSVKMATETEFIGTFTQVEFYRKWIEKIVWKTNF